MPMIGEISIERRAEEGVCVVYRKSFFTNGEWRGMKMPLFGTSHWNDWERGAYIQHAFPMLNDDEREFILTGMTPQQWNEVTLPAEERE